MNDCRSDVSPVNISDSDYFGGSQKWCFLKISQNFIKSPLKICPGPKKKNVWVFQVSWPNLGFCPDPKHFIVNCEQILSNLLENGGKCIEKCNFYVKYFDKIKCYADRPYLVFSELKPEIQYIYFVWALSHRFQSIVYGVTFVTGNHSYETGSTCTTGNI